MAYPFPKHLCTDCKNTNDGCIHKEKYKDAQSMASCVNKEIEEPFHATVHCEYFRKDGNNVWYI